MTGIHVFTILLLIVTAVVGGICIVRRRSALPPHLRPYFENTAELDASIQRHQLANARRREELTDPANTEEAAEYISLNDGDVVDSTFEEALHVVEANLKDNPCDYGQLLGEVYAVSEAYRNPEKAYYHYFIGLSQNGYSVGFQDENHEPPYNGGPIGDFRNESQVSGLVVELGWDKVREIDVRARTWLMENGLEVQEFLEED